MATQTTNVNAPAFKPFSLEDDAYVQGGLLQDVDVEVVEAQWVPWDYGKQGVVSEDILAMKLTLQLLAEDHKPATGPDGQPVTPVEQYWSAGGNFADVVVSDDGYYVGPGPNKAALTKNSNQHIFMQSLRAKGMPVGYLEGGSLAFLKGIKFHLIRTPAPKREGLTNQRADRNQESTIPVCGSIISGPWDGNKPRAAARGGSKAVNGAPAPAATQAAPQAAPNAQIEEVTERLVREVLGSVANGTLPKLSDLKVQVFRKATTDKTIAADQRNAIGKLAENGPWLEERAIASVGADGSVTLV